MGLLDNIFVWILIALMLAVAYWYLTIPSKLPPGPLGLPILGSLLHLSNEPYLNFIEIGKKYGNIFHLYIGSKLLVVLNDFEAIKEAFINQGDAFSGRVYDPHFTDLEGNNFGVIATDGSYWKEHRRFILSNLRNNGVGKLTLEPLLLNEIQNFLAEMRRHSGKTFDIQNLLPASLTNNVNLLITGQRYEYDQSIMESFLEILHRDAKLSKIVNLETFFPWTVHIPGIQLLSDVKENRTIQSNMLNMVKRMISKTQFNVDKNSDTYAEAYAKERNERLKQNEGENIFTESGLFHIGRDLFIAGADTSATTLLWLMLYMTNYPNIQNKVQTEIDNVIGGNREPSYSDRLMTPYTEATIMETHRMISLVPMSVPHRTTRDTDIFGHRVPKDTMVLANVYAVHHDPKIWGDPENFRPDRFLGEDGKVKKTEYLIPFSIGKRACVGEPLARMELYLYFVSLMQHFTFVPAEGVDQKLEAKLELLRVPSCTKVCGKLRQQNKF